MEQSKFRKGKIYKIECNVSGLIYIGSTIKTLEQRLRKHESRYKSYLKQEAKYITSIKILENDDYNITLIRDYPCKSKKELTNMEGGYIRYRHVYEEGICVNKVIPGRTMVEYRQDNKDMIKQNAKIYRDKNRQAINEKQLIKRWAKEDKAYAEMNKLK
jgi:predicted GIY-YIG superfamily endonuclease